ncbi:MAG: selenium cofactor biosynthesis protein YqeC [Chloroflexi bacterium]|nr:selenium cofactor biosynthesis protein YqeC [Chloroflexota bacterium]
MASIAAPGDIVAIVGAGGKTSTMFALSRALAAAGRRVLTTKSTIIYRPTMAQSPGVVEIPPERWATELRGLLDLRREVTVVTGSAGPDRWQGVSADRASELRDAARADCVIVEADGARGRLLKAPADHEPSMPASASLVMPVVNLRAVGRRIDSEQVHRPEQVAALLGISVDGVIGPEHVPRVLLDESGGLKRAPENARVWPVLAGVDAVELPEVEALLRRLVEHPRVVGVVMADREWRYSALVP